MKTDLKIDGTMVLTGAAIIAAIGVTYFVKKKAAAVVDGAKQIVTEGLNPASTENYVYKGINRMGEIVTGTKDWSLGSAIYDKTHTDTGEVDMWGSLGYAANIAMPVTTLLGGGIDYLSNMDYSFLNKVNPVSDQNLAYTGVNKIGSAVTGDKDFSLGVWIYDKTHPAEGKQNDYSSLIIGDTWADGSTGW